MSMIWVASGVKVGREARTTVWEVQRPIETTGWDATVETSRQATSFGSWVELQVVFVSTAMNPFPRAGKEPFLNKPAGFLLQEHDQSALDREHEKVPRSRSERDRLALLRRPRPPKFPIPTSAVSKSHAGRGDLEEEGPEVRGEERRLVRVERWEVDLLDVAALGIFFVFWGGGRSEGDDLGLADETEGEEVLVPDHRQSRMSCRLRVGKKERVRTGT